MTSFALGKGIGCLSLIATFCTGLLIGFFLFWIDDHMTPLIDRETAIRYAIADAHDYCSSAVRSHPVDCTRYRVTSLFENKDGWMMELLSGDGRRAISVIVHRKGETEVEDPVDLYDPQTWPTNRPPVMPNASRVTLHLAEDRQDSRRTPR